MNILQAQMNNYIMLTPIIPWPNITKTAELRQKNRKRRLFIAPQKNMAAAATAFSKQNKSATVDCGFLKVKEVRPPLNRRSLRRFRLCRGDEHWPTKEAAFRKTLPKKISAD
jgi:hypothetical protein